MDTLPALTSHRILDDTMSVLQTHIPLQATGYRCQSADLWRVLVAATAQHHSIEAACADLDAAPHPNTIRRSLADQWQPAQRRTLEPQCNAAIHAALPTWLRDTPHEVAIDPHDIPFYGHVADTPAADWVCGGKTKASTNQHYRCATASVLTRAARVTLAVVFVQPGATMGAIVDQLLTAIQVCGMTIRCLYADKGFCSVAVLQRLQRDAIPAVIAMPRRGPQLRALCTGQESHWASHTLQSAADGAVTVTVAVVRTYPRTRQPRRRATWCLFVGMGIRDSLIGVRQRDRTRFGIESTYRQLEQRRIRTTSPNPALRLMVVGIALVLVNVWVWAQWHYRRKPGRGPRRVDQAVFQLRRFQTFLLAAVTAIYGQRIHIDLAAYRPAPLAHAKW